MKKELIEELDQDILTERKQFNETKKNLQMKIQKLKQQLKFSGSEDEKVNKQAEQL